MKLISPADAIYYARIMNCICAEHKRLINAYYDGGIIAVCHVMRPTQLDQSLPVAR